MRQSMLKEKLRKVGHCFTKGCFIKPFKMILKKKIASLFAAQFSLFDI